MLQISQLSLKKKILILHNSPCPKRPANHLPSLYSFILISEHTNGDSPYTYVPRGTFYQYDCLAKILHFWFDAASATIRTLISAGFTPLTLLA